MINRNIVQRIAKQTNLSETQINVVLEAFCDITLKQVANGSEVRLNDYFTFYTARKAATVKLLKDEEITDKIKRNKFFDDEDNSLLVPASFSFRVKLETFAATMYKQITNKKR